jgi:putative ubiquitin-RnfH superfamily antitoxin RatB of RatAB toxin-antitoxin module
VWVEVVYALAERQVLLQIEVPEGTSLYEAAKLSGIEAMFEDLNLEQAAMGIFGRKSKAPKHEVLREGDRVEIYRPLLIDPKQARLNRAKKSSG